MFIEKTLWECKSALEIILYFLWVIPISCWVYYILISGQNSLEACDEAIKKYEHFIDQMATNDEKINTVLSFANRLCDEDHYAADKINKKAENIDERSVLIPVFCQNIGMISNPAVYLHAIYQIKSSDSHCLLCVLVVTDVQRYTSITACSVRKLNKFSL